MANLAHPDVVDDDRPDAVDDDDDDVEEESHAVTLHSTMAPTFDVDMSCVAQSPSQCTTSGMPSGDSTLPESQSRGPSSSSPPSPSMRWRARRASMRHADVRSAPPAAEPGRARDLHRKPRGDGECDDDECDDTTGKNSSSTRHPPPPLPFRLCRPRPRPPRCIRRWANRARAIRCGGG